MKWKMCPKCGVKLSIVEEESELTIHICPIEKDWYMTFSGNLLRELKKMSELRNKTIEELIHDAFKMKI